MKFAIPFLAIALGLALPVAPLQAAQSYDSCTGFITSLPAVITTQGTWCLRSDLSTALTSGAAITINTNNVTIDCNNFKIGGLAAGLNTQTRGIRSEDRLNHTVRNCNVRGFLYGVNFEGSGSGHVVEDSRFEGNTLTGISVYSDAGVVRNNIVIDTGGNGNGQMVIGIETDRGTDVFNNTVVNVFGKQGADQYAYGIMNYYYSEISGNRVRGTYASGNGNAMGIYTFTSGNIMTWVHGNMIDSRGNGVAGNGVACMNTNVRVQNNVIRGYQSSVGTFCANDGGNISP